MISNLERNWLRYDSQYKIGSEGGETAEQKEEAPPPESDPTVRSVLDTFDGELV